MTGDECARLQRAFLRDVCGTLHEVETGCDIIVCYVPEGDARELEVLLPGAYAFFPQHGASLGDKMHNAISQVLAMGYCRCLLIGSDLPLLKAEIIDDAFHALENSDIILCPTEDGGYYLIGMKEPCEDLFCLEEYGISTVFEKTMTAAASAGKTCVAGAATMDVDMPQDLFRLRERLAREGPDTCRETRKALAEIGSGRQL